jgi:Zn-dependent peptidase ImmA (M78 family)/transcriptional regulator with XRE-family HTH domain
MASSSFPIDVNPAVLRWARSTSGQAASEVATRAKVSEKTLGEWESGKSKPTWISLKRLAKCYQRPVASLLLPEPPARLEIPTDFRTRAGARRELSPPTLLAIRTARWLQSRAIEMRRDLNVESKFSGKKISLANDHVKVAVSERKKLGVELDVQKSWQDRYEALRSWKATLAELGVLVFQFRFPRNEVQGFSFYDSVCPVIVVNEEDAVEARIFTLFHEYAHLLLREPGMCLPSEVSSLLDRSVEPFCNRFASSFLVPDSEVETWSLDLGISPKNDDEAIKQIASRYKVSRDVVLIKLRTEERISESEFKRIYSRWQKNRTIEVKITDKPPEKQSKGPSSLQKCMRQRGAPFVDLVLGAMKRGAITDHDALNYLGIRIKDLDKLEQKR